MINYNYKNNSLFLNGRCIEFQHHIANIEESFDFLIIMFDNPSSGRMKDQPQNNIIAINSSGKIIWSIKDIISKDNLYTILRKNGENIVVVDFNCVNYTIDINKLQVIKNQWIK